MAKKIKLKELKVKSSVTSLKSEEQESTKGGFLFRPGNTVGVSGGKEGWTGLKTRIIINQNLDRLG